MCVCLHAYMLHGAHLSGETAKLKLNNASSSSKRPLTYLAEGYHPRNGQNGRPYAFCCASNFRCLFVFSRGRSLLTRFVRVSTPKYFVLAKRHPIGFPLEYVFAVLSAQGVRGVGGTSYSGVLSCPVLAWHAPACAAGFRAQR